MQELKQDLADRAKDEYEGKTIMICWEHKNMSVFLTRLTILCNICDSVHCKDSSPFPAGCSPYIIARFGLTTQELDWGLNPLSGVSLLCSHAPEWFDVSPLSLPSSVLCKQEDAGENFSAIWVFTPAKRRLRSSMNLMWCRRVR